MAAIFSFIRISRAFDDIRIMKLPGSSPRCWAQLYADQLRNAS